MIESGNAAVELDRCSVRFGRNVVLDHVSLHLPAGTVLGISGDNGVGKSTLLRLIAGLVRPRSGTISVLGGLPSSDVVRSQIGAAIDTPVFYSWMSGEGFLRTQMDMAGRKDEGQSRAALERFDLGAAGRKRIVRYSQGMKKRLALAAASLRHPSLLLLDEPTNALDPGGRSIFYKWLAEEKLRGVSAVVVSHRSADEECCDSVMELTEAGLEVRSGLAREP